MKLTRPQREALYKIWLRSENNYESYYTFRRTVVRCHDYIMVPWAGMLLGIEKDGYTHS